MFQFDELLANVARRPGVYIMQDKDAQYLYIGKAGNLHKRLSQYANGRSLDDKTLALLQRVEAIKTSVTSTETEALLLEYELIKAHKPHYNILLKDGKSYPYIRMEPGEYPRLSLYRGRCHLPGKYFGPYPSTTAVRQTLHLLQKLFHLRQCDDRFFRYRSRPCLQYQIRRCSAPCVGMISEMDYREDLQQALLFLKGQDVRLLRQLVAEMQTHAGKMEFEQAATIRDRITAINRVMQGRQSLNSSNSMDLIALARQGDCCCFETTRYRHGRQIGSRSQIIKTALRYSDGDLINQFIAQNYLDQYAPNEIICSHHSDAFPLLEEALTAQAARKVVIKARVRTQRRSWLKTTLLNAEDKLRLHMASKSAYRDQWLELATLLEFDELPLRVECFDISHTKGESTVAACVVFGKTGIMKSHFRRFNLDSGLLGDDYAAMHEVLTRRYSRLLEESQTLPELIILDGGKGHIKQAERVLEELQINHVQILAIAKDTGRQAGREKLYVSGSNRPILLPERSRVLYLLQRIRDQAHNFAITGHRRKRSKSRITSRLQDIPGIGVGKRQAILQHLGGLKEVKNASIADFQRVPGISRQLATKIYQDFHQD